MGNKIRTILQDGDRQMGYLVRQKMLTAAQGVAADLAKKATTSGAKFVVAQLDLDTNTKNLTNVMKKFHKACKLPALFVSIDPTAMRSSVMVKAEVPKGGPEIDCKAWAESIAPLVEGRAGGKPTSGTCNGT